MSARRVLALLGRKDEPTDAVEEYCRYLGNALRERGIEMEIVRVRWAERGWAGALGELRKKLSQWPGEWVLVQYTALAWSARGFPLKFLRVMRVLHEAGVRTAVVLHDVEPYAGTRTIDELRRRTQLHTMRRALHRSDLAIFTVALRAISWLGDAPAKAVFVPVGANLPVAAMASRTLAERKEVPLRVAVFGITGGESGRRESARIVEALRFAASEIGRLTFHAFGRHADDFETVLRDGLRDAPIDVRVQGVLPPEQVVEALSEADVMLFLRGVISTRRGSAIAGIACGLPVIAFGGGETAEPITETGVVLLAQGQDKQVGEALVRVLKDETFRAGLAEQSRIAYQQHFAWKAIAERYIEALSRPGTN
jgi:glycosyltransferase involved in cell wall biosynthesis